MIGTNNSGSSSGRQIADGILLICRELRERLPETKILLLSIFPRDGRESDARRINAQAGQIISGLADNKWIYYRDINSCFLDAQGRIRTEMMPDGLHPNEQGYQVWAEAMEPIIEKLMKSCRN